MNKKRWWSYWILATTLTIISILSGIKLLSYYQTYEGFSYILLLGFGSIFSAMWIMISPLILSRGKK